MTGLYKQSVIERKGKARADVVNLEKSLSSLKNQDSFYAQEHRALLKLLKSVADIYESAPCEIATIQLSQSYAEKCIAACAGLPNGALDGGWTALGMGSYAKRLEDALNDILCLNTDQLANAYIIAGSALALRFTNLISKKEPPCNE